MKLYSNSFTFGIFIGHCLGGYFFSGHSVYIVFLCEKLHNFALCTTDLRQQLIIDECCCRRRRHVKCCIFTTLRGRTSVSQSRQTLSLISCLRSAKSRFWVRLKLLRSFTAVLELVVLVPSAWSTLALFWSVSIRFIAIPKMHHAAATSFSLLNTDRINLCTKWHRKCHKRELVGIFYTVWYVYLFDP